MALAVWLLVYSGLAIMSVDVRKLSLFVWLVVFTGLAVIIYIYIYIYIYISFFKAHLLILCVVSLIMT